MSPRNEEVDSILRELRVYGVKGAVEHSTKHIAITWVLPNGKERKHFSPASGSDRRGWLKSRSRVRRWMREDGMIPVSEESRPTLFKALQLPEPVETPDQRVSKLEAENQILVDWIVELQASIHELSRANKVIRAALANPAIVTTIAYPGLSELEPRPEVPVEEPTKQEIVVVSSIKPPAYEAKGRPEQILSLLAFDGWTSMQTLVNATGMTKNHVSNVLWRLKSSGKVDNAVRGYWRKLPVKTNGHPVALEGGSGGSS